MKKLSYLFICLFACSSIFVSCSDDDDDDPFLDPKVEVICDGASVSSGAVIEDAPGTSLKFNIKFTMGGDKLTSIKITSKLSGETFIQVDSALNEGLFNSGDKNLSYAFNTSVANVEKVLTFSTTDKKSRTASFTVTVKPKASETVGNSNISVSKVTLMGAQGSIGYGSFYSVDLGEVMFVAAARTNQGKVDFAYYYGSNTKATIGCPSDKDLGEIAYTAGTNGKTSQWTTKNTTKFIKCEATAANIEARYDEYVGYDAVETAATQLVVNDAYAYKTQGGKTGVFIVTNINGTNAGEISVQLYTK